MTQEIRPVAAYDTLVSNMHILPEWVEKINAAKAKIIEAKSAYDGFLIPWEILAVIHMREAGNDFRRQILNGEPWAQTTKLVPAGIGPFDSWKDSTWYAIVHHGLVGLIGEPTNVILQFLETWNGWGYFSRGKQSPYLWSGSNMGLGVGKYVKDCKDGYDLTAVDQQIGAAVMYLALTSEVAIATNPRAENIRKLQTLMNDLGADLKVDGQMGPKSEAAFAKLFG